MHYMTSIIRLLLIVFLFTNKTTRDNMTDLFNQFLEYLNHAFKRKLGVMYYHGIEDDVTGGNDVKILDEIKEKEQEVVKVDEVLKEDVSKVDEVLKEEVVKVDEIVNEKKEEVKVIKFEDKYIEKYKNFKNEYYFTDEEKLEEEKKYSELRDIFNEKREKGLKEMNNKLKIILSIFDKGGNTTAVGIEELMKYYNMEAEYEDDPECCDLTELMNELTDIRNETTKEYDEFSNMVFSEEDTREAARQHVLNNKLEGFINNYVIEMTPLGNVYMRFNNSKKSFEYFSNNTIPYRYLEPVGRKYVLTYFCKPLFIDIDDELKRAQIKKDEGDALKEANAKEGLKEGAKEGKDIFARLKSYNNDSSSHMKNKNRNQPSAPLPPQIKANLPNVNSSEKMLLKENANRYTWEGRIANLSILKKVEKKMVDKNYEMSFADFKKMQSKK